MRTIPSPPSSIRPRLGFTLIEMLISCGIGMLVMGAVLQAFFGANKAQAIAAGGSVLKSSGQKAVNQLYELLHQNRHVFDRTPITDTWLARLPIDPYDASASRLQPGPDVTNDLRLPLLKDTGTFLTQNAAGTNQATFDASSVGNSLFFATLEPQAKIIQAAPAAIHSAAFGGDTFMCSAMRLHFFYMSRRPLGTAPAVRAGSDYVYYLMHWESDPYLDYADVKKWMARVKANDDGTADALIVAKLNALKDTTKPVHYAGALDIGSTNADLATGDAVYSLSADTTTYLDLVQDNTNRFATKRFGHAVDFSMKASFGTPMVAFNTESSPAPSVKVPGLDVPAYANDYASKPYGFEVMIAGPPEYRRALVRLSLAARSNPGGVMIGQTFQQVVQLFEYGGG